LISIRISSETRRGPGRPEGCPGPEPRLLRRSGEWRQEKSRAAPGGGEIRSARPFPEPSVLPGRSRTRAVMRGFSRRVRPRIPAIMPGFGSAAASGGGGGRARFAPPGNPRGPGPRVRMLRAARKRRAQSEGRAGCDREEGAAREKSRARHTEGNQGTLARRQGALSVSRWGGRAPYLASKLRGPRLRRVCRVAYISRLGLHFSPSGT
jgi:hypothetical protein